MPGRYVAIPVEVNSDAKKKGGAPEAQRGGGFVCVFFSAKRVSARIAAQVEAELQNATSGKRHRVASDNQLLNIGNGRGGDCTFWISGGDAALVKALRRVCVACEMVYAEVARPAADGSMQVCAHVSRSTREEGFYADSHSIDFPDSADPMSPLRSLKALSRMSSNDSMVTSLTSKTKPVLEAPAPIRTRLWHWLFPMAVQRARARAAARREEEMSTLCVAFAVPFPTERRALSHAGVCRVAVKCERREGRRVG